MRCKGEGNFSKSGVFQFEQYLTNREAAPSTCGIYRLLGLRGSMRPGKFDLSLGSPLAGDMALGTTYSNHSVYVIVGWLVKFLA